MYISGTAKKELNPVLWPIFFFQKRTKQKTILTANNNLTNFFLLLLGRQMKKNESPKRPVVYAHSAPTCSE